MLEAALLVVFPMLVAFGGASDLLTMTIQNRVSILLIAGFVIVSLAIGLPLAKTGEPMDLEHLLSFRSVSSSGHVAGWAVAMQNF